MLLAARYHSLVPDHIDADSAAFDGHDRHFRPLGVRFEEHLAVDAGIRALLLSTIRLRVDQGDGPPLKLVPIPSRVDVLRRVVNIEPDTWGGVSESAFDPADSEVRYVYAEPLPSELLRRMDRSTAAAERVEHDAAWVRERGDDHLTIARLVLRN